MEIADVTGVHYPSCQLAVAIMFHSHSCTGTEIQWLLHHIGSHLFVHLNLMLKLKHNMGECFIEIISYLSFPTYVGGDAISFTASNLAFNLASFSEISAALHPVKA